jgi:hypothetical protein
MSRRITTKTQMTNKDLALDAIKMAGLSYSEEGASTLRITSGDLRNATINLTNGNVTGDTDYHGRDALGALRKFYSEAQIRERCRLEGHTVEERHVMQDGRIRLVCSGMFA